MNFSKYILKKKLFLFENEILKRNSNFPFLRECLHETSFLGEIKHFQLGFWGQSLVTVYIKYLNETDLIKNILTETKVDFGKILDS